MRSQRQAPCSAPRKRPGTETRLAGSRGALDDAGAGRGGPSISPGSAAHSVLGTPPRGRRHGAGSSHRPAGTVRALRARPRVGVPSTPRRGRTRPPGHCPRASRPCGHVFRGLHASMPVAETTNPGPAGHRRTDAHVTGANTALSGIGTEDVGRSPRPRHTRLRCPKASSWARSPRCWVPQRPPGGTTCGRHGPCCRSLGPPAPWVPTRKVTNVTERGRRASPAGCCPAPSRAK